MKISDVLPTDLFAGRVVFVTGGGSGINLGIAHTFASLGADVSICGRNAERLAGAADELRGHGHGVLTTSADVRDYDAVAAALAATREQLGPVSTLVCGAAGNFAAPAEKLSANGFRTVVDIDLNGTFNATRAAFDQLAETKGSVLFVSASQADTAYAYQAHVGAAKAGIDMLMRNLALEWGPYGIRCNAVAPGPIADTEGMRRLEEVAGRDTWLSMIPLGRYGTVDEIGAMAAFLASPLASFVTGARVTVDGGQGLTGSAVFNAAARS
jgi:NAD(P)-dependent dehydrogenase (short-subunit alcohol dehydrogenase family)